MLYEVQDFIVINLGDDLSIVQCIHCGAHSENLDELEHYSDCHKEDFDWNKFENDSEEVMAQAKKELTKSTRPSIGIKSFILGGNSTFTIQSKKTNTRFTFKVSQPDKTSPHFVSVLTGSDNNSDYSYLGTIFDKQNFVKTRKSRFSNGAPCYLAFSWLWNELNKGNEKLEQIDFWHEGKCCRCGRKLTTPESIEAGIGPICAGL